MTTTSIHASAEPGNPCVLPFGKYRGEPLRLIPTAYLSWVLKECKLGSGVRTAIRAELLTRPDRPSDLPPEQEAPDLVCRTCGGVEVDVSWQGQAGGGRLIRANCAYCGRYVAFLPQTTANVALASQQTKEPV